MMRRVLAGAVAVVALATFAACTDGGGDDAEATTTTALELDACAFLSSEEAATLMGGPVVTTPPDAIERDEITVAVCEYAREDNTPGSVSVIVRREDGQADQLDAALESLRTETYKDRTTEDVPDLGDAAIWVADGPARQLSIFDGDDYIVLTFPVGTTKDAAVALAQTVLQRVEDSR